MDYEVVITHWTGSRTILQCNNAMHALALLLSESRMEAGFKTATIYEVGAKQGILTVRYSSLKHAFVFGDESIS